MCMCSAIGCGRKIYAIGWCRKHYQQNNKAEVHPRLPYKNEKYKPICTVSGCDRYHRTVGLCGMHYQRLVTKGDVHWRSDRREYGSGKEWHLNPDGYILRYEPDNPNSGPNGQVYQHRHVMSGIIGRPWSSKENVHHVNGDKSDNKPENLELWDSGQPAGQRVTDRVEWCIHYLSDNNINAALKIRPELAEDIEKFLLKLTRRL